MNQRKNLTVNLMIIKGISEWNEGDTDLVQTDISLFIIQSRPVTKLGIIFTTDSRQEKF